MSENNERKNEVNEQELGQVAGGKSSGVKVWYICRNCRALVPMWFGSKEAAPSVTMVHCPECDHLSDADLRDW